MSRVPSSHALLRALDLPRADAATLGEPSDNEIIEAVVQGDPRVAPHIHDRLVNVIDQTLYRVMGRREIDHDDLLQNCFEQILRSLTSRAFAGSCSLRTWATRISTNVALNALRSRCRERRVISRQIEIDDETLGASSAQGPARVELGRVRQILVEMSSAKAEVLILHDVHGYSLNEIAVMLQLTVAATQSRLVRGRTEFRRRYGRYSGGRSSGQKQVGSRP